MLILSRRADETLVFPNLGITVHILRITGGQVRIGVEAPPAVRVVRGELASETRTAIVRQGDGQAAAHMQMLLLDASLILQRLHMAAEAMQWQEAEPLVFSLFRLLKHLNDQVALMSALEPPAPGPSRKRALIVDDNHNETKLLASYLRLKQFEIETAANGAEAMAYLSSQAIPDVVVLDMNMPQFDGRWTVNELRSNRRFDGLKIFAVSGIHPNEYGVGIGREGVDRWFRKPLNPDELVDEIQRSLEDGLTSAAT